MNRRRDFERDREAPPQFLGNRVNIADRPAFADRRKPLLTGRPELRKRFGNRPIDFNDFLAAENASCGSEREERFDTSGTARQQAKRSGRCDAGNRRVAQRIEAASRPNTSRKRRKRAPLPAEFD
jgi:hypothetical protein